MAETQQSTAMQFILVDDDNVSNLLARTIISRRFSSVQFSSFTSPLTAIDFLKTVTTPATIFLDINMPTITGWDVLEMIQTFPQQTIDLFSIYIVSSSVDIDDHKRAENSHLVLGYIEKPLTDREMLRHFPI